MNIPEVFVKKVGVVWQLWIHSHGVDAPAGQRLLKGTTRSFPNFPPEFDWTYTEPKPAYAEAEKLQTYLTEWNTK